MDLSIVVHDAEKAVRVSTVVDFDRAINKARDEARTLGRLNLISIQTSNGNDLALVVGGKETVLAFEYGHHNPPYYVSRGDQARTQPVMTCYVGLAHHTEFRRQHVIPYEKGLRAAREFAESETLPKSIEWIET
ncbi:Imm1 family immunity protein [Bradyrhizobium sp. B120]|uniref:Imm1 family immunity protein n=1 Tax=Bradyrhizobium sp. B120 TaxID=3410088 RepID=UPI003B986CBF